MAPPSQKSRVLGIALAFVGLLFVGINGVMIKSADSFLPKLFVTGMIILFLGIGLILFPPYDAKMDDPTLYFKEIFQKTPLFYKFMWLIFILLGVASLFFIMDYYNFHLF